MVKFAIDTYTQILEMALPVAIIFGFGNIIVGTFLRALFGGKLWLGK